MLERQQKIRKARESFVTLGTEESLDLALLLNSVKDGLTSAGAMFVSFTAAPGTVGKDIFYTRD